MSGIKSVENTKSTEDVGQLKDSVNDAPESVDSAQRKEGQKDEKVSEETESAETEPEMSSTSPKAGENDNDISKESSNCPQSTELAVESSFAQKYGLMPNSQPSNEDKDQTKVQPVALNQGGRSVNKIKW